MYKQQIIRESVSVSMAKNRAELAFVPIKGTEQIFVNGLLMNGGDYKITKNRIRFNKGIRVSITDIICANYEVQTMLDPKAKAQVVKWLQLKTDIKPDALDAFVEKFFTGK